LIYISSYQNNRRYVGTERRLWDDDVFQDMSMWKHCQRGWIVDYVIAKSDVRQGLMKTSW